MLGTSESNRLPPHPDCRSSAKAIRSVHQNWRPHASSWYLSNFAGGTFTPIWIAFPGVIGQRSSKLFIPSLLHQGRESSIEMTLITLTLTVEEVQLSAALASFRREFIDCKMPGYKSNTDEAGKGAGCSPETDARSVL